MFSLARIQENLRRQVPHLPQRRYGLTNCATTTLYKLVHDGLLYISGSPTIDLLGSNVPNISVGDLITILSRIRGHL